jgi:hypothetical protein
MVKPNQTPTIPDDIPFPLLERGDVVRLKEPYELAPSRYLATDTEATAAALAATSIDPDDLPDHLDIEHVLHSPQYEEIDSAPPIRTFTHGIVAEVATRYPARDYNLPDGRIVDYQSVGGGPPRNVALFLFNPETGLIFLDRGAGETGRPTFVDFHVQCLILVQKHNEVYSHREIDIGAVYNLWGITDIVDTLPGDDTDEPTEPQPFLSLTETGPAAAASGSWLSVDPDRLIRSLAAEAQERLQNESLSLHDAIHNTIESNRADLWRELSFVEQIALADQLTEMYSLEDAYETEQASEAPYGSEDWREAILSGYFWHILQSAIIAVLDADHDDL